jgi:hypothetical protein
MSKKINISLLGKELTLNFGVARFYNLFKEATGKDILNYTEVTGTTGLVEIVQGIVYGGYYAECKLNKVNPELTKDEIFENILDSESTLISEIFEKYIKSVSSNGVAPGEAVSQLIEQG